MTYYPLYASEVAVVLQVIYELKSTETNYDTLLNVSQCVLTEEK